MISFNKIIESHEALDKIIPALKAFFPKEKHFGVMTREESGFVGGLLKTCQPKKILEVGVAFGGTTAIALQLLENLDMPYEMHSVDLSKTWCGKEVGFLAKSAKENNLLITPPRSTLCGEHKFYIGKYLPQVIDEIGGGIDFVILDTVHYTPGELLDFPVMLPYLKDGAIVVLHDVVLNQRNFSYHKPDAHATNLLLSTVVAPEKFLNSVKADKNQPFQYPNIGAFKVDESTRSHIENVFMALMLTWHYLPKEDEIKIYRDFYAKHYSAELLTIFDEAVRLNNNNVAFKKVEETPAKPATPTPAKPAAPAPAKPATPTPAKPAAPAPAKPATPTPAKPAAPAPAKTATPTPAKPAAPAPAKPATPAKVDSDALEILTYQTHVGKKGWGKWINENRISNPPEDKFDIQAIKINFPNHKIYYQVYYNAEEGWSEEVSNGEQAGTTGKSKSIYGMRIRLDEAGSKEFDIFYRVHSVDGIWTPWAKNSEVIYSYGQKINSIQIKLEPKTT